jgi:hypothetical protein
VSSRSECGTHPAAGNRQVLTRVVTLMIAAVVVIYLIAAWRL